jgi:antitoxin MazE
MTNTHQTQIIKIGNSNGIRIPKEYLTAFESKNVVIKLVNDSLVITPIKSNIFPRNKWEEILGKMTIAHDEDFNDFETTISDGIDDL